MAAVAARGPRLLTDLRTEFVARRPRPTPGAHRAAIVGRPGRRPSAGALRAVAVASLPCPATRCAGGDIASLTRWQSCAEATLKLLRVPSSDPAFVATTSICSTCTCGTSARRLGLRFLQQICACARAIDLLSM